MRLGHLRTLPHCEPLNPNSRYYGRFQFSHQSPSLSLPLVLALQGLFSLALQQDTTPLRPVSLGMLQEERKEIEGMPTPKLPASVQAPLTLEGYTRCLAKQLEVDEALVLAVLVQESHPTDPFRIGKGDSRGPFQIKPIALEEVGLSRDAQQLPFLVYGGILYLKTMLTRFSDLPTALAAYNMGPVLRDPHEFIKSFLIYQWVMILSTPGSISEIDRKSSSFARKIKKISALHGTYPKTTHINTHAYLCVFKRHFVGIPQGPVRLIQREYRPYVVTQLYVSQILMRQEQIRSTTFRPRPVLRYPLSAEELAVFPDQATYPSECHLQQFAAAASSAVDKT